MLKNARVRHAIHISRTHGTNENVLNELNTSSTDLRKIYVPISWKSMREYSSIAMSKHVRKEIEKKK